MRCFIRRDGVVGFLNRVVVVVFVVVVDDGLVDGVIISLSEVEVVDVG